MVFKAHADHDEDIGSDEVCEQLADQELDFRHQEPFPGRALLQELECLLSRVAVAVVETSVAWPLTSSAMIAAMPRY